MTISHLASLAALLIGTAIMLLGNSLLGTLLPVRGHLEEFSTLLLGLQGSSYFGGFVLGCIYGPNWLQRAGHIRTFAALAAISAAGTLIYALAVDAWVWVLLRAITGFAMAGLYTTIESWLNERSTNEERGRVLAVYTVINLTVITGGQLMLNLYDPVGFELFSVVAILTALSLVPLALTRSPTPGAVTAARLNPRRLYQRSPVGVLGCLAVGLANGAFWTLGPVFAQGIGLSIRDVTIFMAITVIGGAIGQWPLGQLSDRIDRRRVILVASLGAAVFAGALAMVTRYYPQAILLVGFFWGGFALPIYAISIAHANDLNEDQSFVETSSGLLLVYGTGAVIGPFVASGLMEAVGPLGLFVFAGLVYLAYSIRVAWRLVERRVGVPSGEKEPFVSVPRTSPALFQLDPRGDVEAGESSGETSATSPLG